MRLCEACGLDIPVDVVAVRVGACEFPFLLHDSCREAMAPVTGAIEEMCRWAQDQPEGLTYLGSWDTATENNHERARSDDETD